LLTAIETAIIGMCPGEYRKITVPPEEAYGDKKIKMPDGMFLKGDELQ
jgi:FKBP-type peptidyl-prolyl cis-trans isomerase 2